MVPGQRRVVVTGVGALTSLGLDWAALRRALADGRGGVRPLAAFDPAGAPVRLASEVAGFDARDFVEKKDRKQLKLMARTSQLAVAAARRAFDDAALGPGALDADRLGVVFGAGTIPGELADLAGPAVACRAGEVIDLARWGRDGLAVMPPMWMLHHVPNMPACHISILHDARGPNNTLTQTDAASLLALGEAGRILARGGADVLLAGGADTRVTPLTMARYSLYTEVARGDGPAPRPFDRGRDGQVLGEGGAALVLEDLDHARRRGARARAELVGFASGFDPGLRGDGLARVVAQALARAGITPAELDHVNAHAPATAREDAWEARGLRQAVGDAEVVAFKSYLGSLGCAGGAAELACSLAALEDGVVPATLHHDETGPDCPVNVLRAPRRLRRPFVLKLSCTELGQCAAAVLRAGE